MQNTAIAWLTALLHLSPSLLTHLHCSSPIQWRLEGSRAGSEQHAPPVPAAQPVRVRIIWFWDLAKSCTERADAAMLEACATQCSEGSLQGTAAILPEPHAP